MKQINLTLLTALFKNFSDNLYNLERVNSVK